MSGIPGGSGFGRYDGNTFHYDRPASDEGSRALDQQFEDPHSGLPHHGPGQPPPTSSASTSGNSGFPPSSGSSGWAPPMPPYGAPQGRGAGGTGRGYGNQYEVTGLTQTTLRDAQSGEIHYLQRDVRYQDRSAFPTETYSAGPGFFPAQPHSAGGHGLYDDYAPAGPSSSYGPVSASRAAYAQEPQFPSTVGTCRQRPHSIILLPRNFKAALRPNTRQLRAYRPLSHPHNSPPLPMRSTHRGWKIGTETKQRVLLPQRPPQLQCQERLRKMW